MLISLFFLPMKNPRTIFAGNKSLINLDKKMNEYDPTIPTKILQNNQEDIISGFGDELHLEAEKGVLAWQKAAHNKWVSRGIWIANKP